MNEHSLPISRKEGLYTFLVALFSTVVLISNLIAVKVCTLPFFEGLALPCGLITYPLTFIIGDLITEIYGGSRARLMVYTGFIMGFLTHGVIMLSVNLPPHPEWVSTLNPFGYTDTESYQTAFASVFGLNGFALGSSVLAYSVSQLLDIRIFGFMKEITQGRYLWLRNGSSTLISQVVDTLVVNILFLYCGLRLDLGLVIQVSLYCYLFKAVVALFSIPLFYGLVWGAKRFISGEEFFSKDQPDMNAELSYI